MAQELQSLLLLLWINTSWSCIRTKVSTKWAWLPAIGTIAVGITLGGHLERDDVDGFWNALYLTARTASLELGKVCKTHYFTQAHALLPGKRQALDKDTPMGAILEQLEQAKASISAKVEHPFRVIKRQFDYTKVKYRGLAKNTANLVMLSALSNLWMVRKRLLNMGAQG